MSNKQLKMLLVGAVIGLVLVQLLPNLTRNND